MTQEQFNVMATALGDQVVKFVEDSEQSQHPGGGKCLDCRSKAVVFLALRLGLMPIQWGVIDPELVPVAESE